ncbi:hypothetical protein ACOACO_01595 [Nocardioides sp. CPCC 205120]|uniref:hypothetical protein n=1 Tax=Nocardioides sp. CPCC 205120 TaxID=3406462 RepID=UPI003B501120
MPSYDYEVDLPSLAEAAQGLAETVQLFKDKDVEDLVPSRDAIGHDGLWDAVDEFKGRWEEGMNNLCQDVEEMAGRLGKITMNYAEADQAGNDGFTRVAGSVGDVDVLGG